MFVVVSLSGTCSVTKSDTDNISSRVATTLLFPMGICTGASATDESLGHGKESSYAEHQTMQGL